jgi:hypothetical protein
MEFFSIGTLLASLTEAHIAKGDLRHTDSRQQRELATLCLPQAFVTSVRLLCEREVPLTHRLPAICLLQMHRKKGSLSLSLRFLLPMSEPGQNAKYSPRVDVFCFASINRHPAVGPAGPFGADIVAKVFLRGGPQIL